MVDFLSYEPATLIGRAMFNFDAFGGTNFVLSGAIRVSVSDSFTKAQYDASAGFLASDTYTSAASGNGNWTASQLDNINTLLQIYTNFIPVQYSPIVNNSGLTPAQVGLTSDINISLISRSDLTFAGEAALNNDLTFLYLGSRADIVINTAKIEPSPDFSTVWYSGHVMMHELGHVLGLAHPHLRFVGTNPLLTTDFLHLVNVGFDKLGFSISSGLDMNKEYFSIMSYDDQAPPEGNTFAQTPMILDVIALQSAYGEGRGSSGASDDTITPGADGLVTSYRTYFDKGGSDTIDLANYVSGAYLHMGTTIDGASHLVGVGMSKADQAIMSGGGNPQSLRWFYGTFENASGSAGDDLVIGNGLDNAINGRGGADRINGGDGYDTARYTGRRADYVVSGDVTSAKVQDLVPGRDGVDTLQNIENLRFQDGALVLDIARDAGLPAYLLFRAAFGRRPDDNGLHFWAAANLGEDVLSSLFVASSEFVAGYRDLDAAGFVSKLYLDVFGRKADASGLAFWVDAMAHGLGPSEILRDFAFSAEARSLVAADTQTGFWIA